MGVVVVGGGGGLKLNGGFEEQIKIMQRIDERIFFKSCCRHTWILYVFWSELE